MSRTRLRVPRHPLNGAAPRAGPASQAGRKLAGWEPAAGHGPAPLSRVRRERTMPLFLMVFACLVGLAHAGVPAVGTDKPALNDLRARAEAALESGDFPSATALLEQGLKMDPEWKDGLWAMGLALYQSDRYEAAVPYLAHLTRIDSDKGAGWALLGMCEFQLGRYGSAVEHLDRADRLGIPANVGLQYVALLNRGMARIQLGHYGTAAELLGRLAPRKSAEERDQLVTALGFAAMGLNLGEPLAPERQDQLRTVGEAYYQSAAGDRVAAGAIFQKLCEKYPRASLLHYAQGSLLLTWLEEDAAEREFRAELALTPDSFPARLGLAYVALQSGVADPASGLVPAREAVRLRPDSYPAHFYLGQLLLRNHEPAAAIVELEAARRLSPSTSSVHFELAKAYRAVNRDREADHELDEFKRLKALEEPARAERVTPASH
jgi:tetratricopeptide (TPR) repeat protein